jgi:hypothetical protein
MNGKMKRVTIAAVAIVAATFWSEWLRGNAPAAFAADRLSPEALTAIAPVYRAYIRVETEQALLPPPKGDAERLIRLSQIDQAAREGPGAMGNIDLSGLPPDQHAAAFAAAWDEINKHDLADQKALKAMLPAEGWFSISHYGAQAAVDAFLIVQHAVNDRALQRSVLAAMERMIANGEVDRQAYAMLYDRAQSQDGRPGRYGTQLLCEGGKWVLAPQADPEHVNGRRKAMGFPLTVEQNIARFANRPPCG